MTTFSTYRLLFIFAAAMAAFFLVLGAPTSAHANAAANAPALPPELCSNEIYDQAYDKVCKNGQIVPGLVKQILKLPYFASAEAAGPGVMKIKGTNLDQLTSVMFSSVGGLGSPHYYHPMSSQSSANPNGAILMWTFDTITINDPWLSGQILSKVGGYNSKGTLVVSYDFADFGVPAYNMAASSPDREVLVIEGDGVQFADKIILTTDSGTVVINATDPGVSITQGQITITGGAVGGLQISKIDLERTLYNIGSLNVNLFVRPALVAPTVQIDSPAPGALSQDTPDVNFTVSGEEYTVTCSVDGGAASSCSSPLDTGALGDGSHSVLVEATNAAGSGSATATFTVDATAPELTVSASLTVEATDANGASVAYTPTATDASGIASLTCDTPSGTTLALGDHTITCVATDNAGNSSTSNIAVSVVDTTAPQIASMADIDAQATNSSGIVVDYDTPLATDAVDGATDVSCDPASGTLFAVGTTTATCSTTDASGNGASSTFDVNVAAPLMPAPTINGMSGASGTFYGSAPYNANYYIYTSGTVDSVSCSADGGPAIPASLYYSGTWRCLVSGLGYGTHEIVATATNAGGSATSSASFTLNAPTWIYYSDDQTGQIYRTGYEASMVTALTSGTGSRSNPIPSPDRSQIAYVRLDWSTNPATYEIRVMNADGTNDHKVGDIGTSMTPRATWSADGSKVLWYGISNSAYRILVAPADGSSPATTLTTPPAGTTSMSEYAPKVSPDGTKVVFQAYYQMGSTGTGGTYTVNLDGSNLTQLSPQGASNRGYVWSPDGSFLLFAGSSDLRRLDVATGTVTVIATGLADYRYTLSPDGSRVVLTKGNGYQYTMWTVNVDGTGLRQLTNAVTASNAQWTGCFATSWSLDGRYALTSCYFGGGMYIGKVDVDATTPVNQPQSLGGSFRSKNPMLAGYTA